MKHDELKELLDSESRRINSPAFIAEDPVSFPRRFSRKEDIEIASLLCATLAWGNRRMICRDCDRMLALMDNAPYDYVMDEGYLDLDPQVNIHRTFFGRNLRHYLAGLRRVYLSHGSVEGLARHERIADDPYPAWKLVAALNRELAAANDGVADSRCLPLSLDTTALKRVNMALRWLVRRDGIVDMGVWDVITPAQLFIPLDVHVGDTARELGLLTRRANDRKSVVQLTETLRSFNPGDPVIYDFALFGIGMRL